VQGVEEANVALAKLYENGIGVATDEARSAQWLKPLQEDEDT